MQPFSRGCNKERGIDIMSAQKSAQGLSFLAAIGKSFYDSIGDIVFGMEDGTVSIFGLVFGVASSTTSSSVVLLAGATGAIAAAVSMMAGTFLDVESTNDQTKAQLARHPKTFLQVEAASELQIGRSQQKNPFVQAAWMFISDVFAAFVPVVPFAFLPLGP